MASSAAASRQPRIFALLCGVAVIAALYVAKQILLPFALAVFLSFLLAPLVSRLEKWRFPRIAAVLVAVALTFAALGALGSTLVQQVYDLANRLPEYETNLVHKARAFQSGQGGIVEKVGNAIKSKGSPAYPARQSRT